MLNRPSYNCHMMNIIQQVTDPMPTNLSYIVSAIITVTLATKLLLSLLLLRLLLSLLSKLSNYFATDHFAADN